VDSELRNSYLLFIFLRRASWYRAARIGREGAVLYLGAFGAPEHVR
jgi:hypothetical protein